MTPLRFKNDVFILHMAFLTRAIRLHGASSQCIYGLAKRTASYKRPLLSGRISVTVFASATPMTPAINSCCIYHVQLLLKPTESRLWHSIAAREPNCLPVCTVYLSVRLSRVTLTCADKYRPMLDYSYLTLRTQQSRAKRNRANLR